LQGLAAEVEAIQALVVSEETAAGLGPINEDRRERGFTPLEVRVVSPLISQRNCSPEE
jgi:phosphopantetheine adenylyltransferase